MLLKDGLVKVRVNLLNSEAQVIQLCDVTSCVNLVIIVTAEISIE